MTKQECEHIARVKSLPCGNCGVLPPSDAHHLIENGTRVSHYATIPLCHEFCHQGSQGIHGDKALWRIMKNTELKILADTIGKLYET
jgi:hypothetical protein